MNQSRDALLHVYLSTRLEVEVIMFLGIKYFLEILMSVFIYVLDLVIFYTR